MPQKRPRKERVTIAEELGTMSKNNLRRIILGIRPVWRFHSLTLHPLLIICNMMYVILNVYMQLSRYEVLYMWYAVRCGFYYVECTIQHILCMYNLLSSYFKRSKRKTSGNE